MDWRLRVSRDSFSTAIAVETQQGIDLISADILPNGMLSTVTIYGPCGDGSSKWWVFDAQKGCIVGAFERWRDEHGRWFLRQRNERDEIIANEPLE